MGVSRLGRIPLREGRLQGVLVRNPAHERGACRQGAPRWGGLCVRREAQSTGSGNHHPEKGRVNNL